MTLDKSGYAGDLLMDFSKALACIDHELLHNSKIACLWLYKKAFKMIHSYLSKRRQRVKINGSFSTWKEVHKGVS